MISRHLPKPGNRSFFLFGPRMTGKSTWLAHEFKNALRIDLLNHENYLRYLANPGLLAGEAESHLRRNKNGWILIDEIQRVPDLLNEVHRLIEERKIRFGLSGSSARKLKKGGANLLAGRATEMRVFPFTIPELDASDSPAFKSKLDLDSAIRWGTLPPVWTSELSEKKEILRSYASVYLREEIQAEGMVRNLPAFSKVLQLAAESIAQEVNYSTLSREIGVASKTIASHFSILEDTLIGFHLPPWTRTVRKELAGSSKFYLFDNGVTSALRENLTDPPTGDVLGSLFEQFVIQQVRAILSYQGFEGSFSFWRARGGNEVDLIISRGSKPILAVEIKNTSRPSRIDYAGLRSFSDEYPKVPGILVSRQPRSSKDGPFESYPVLDFLRDLHAGQLIR
jgi:predicted AAA+ superfamily ATPase